MSPSPRKYPMAHADVIATAVARHIFPWRQFIVVPNVSWGLVSWEMDLAVLSESGVLYEVEIKTSKADLKADASKQKWKCQDFGRRIGQHYVALPAEKYHDMGPLVPATSGIITVPQFGKPALHRKAVANRSAEKVSDADRQQLMRLGCMRYWARQDACHAMLEALHGLALHCPLTAVPHVEPTT